MESNRPEGNHDHVGLAPFVTVVLSYPAGLFLPTTDRFDPFPVSLIALRLLRELARQDSDMPADALSRVLRLCKDEQEKAALNRFMAELQKRNLLVPSPSRPVSGAPGKLQPPVVKDAFPEGATLVANMPLVMQVSGWGFDVVDHDGNKRARLTPFELTMLASFVEPARCWQAHASHCRERLERAADVADFRDAVLKFWRLGLLHSYGQNQAGPGATDGKEQAMIDLRPTPEKLARQNRMIRIMDEYMVRFEQEHLHSVDSHQPRVRVIPGNATGRYTTLALGLLMAAARNWEGGRLQADYLFVPDWETRKMRLDRYAREPGVYLFSSYIWCHEENLALSARVKAANPNSLTVHGGPQAPKYPVDVEAYFRDHPHVDVIVHGEGEETFCHLLDAMAGRLGHDNGGLDLSPLKHVPGLSFRHGGAVVRTAPRPRIKDIDALPSPFLDGTFESYSLVAPTFVVIETNRGCPYSCTFCDWGSATGSTVRKFSLERVFAEMEWCARAGVVTIYIGDANFGMYERDVEIVKKVVELNRRYGYPQKFGTNYAKNKIKYLRPIVEILAKAGILSEGVVALQSMDEQTLSAIRRSNIKTEQYDALAQEFRAAGLPLYVDIMVGLPGSTCESFADDLQKCIDREISARIFQTELLSNSPMNAPEYREQFRIKTEPTSTRGGRMSTRLDREGSLGLGRAIVVETATYTRQEYDQMLDLMQMYKLFENQGVLRQLTRHVRQVTGHREIDLIRDLCRVARSDPQRWPYIAFVLTSVPHIMMPPVSWRFFIEEIRRFLLECYTLPDDSALRTVLEVQHALLPAPGRQFPLRLELAHDYAKWHRDMVSAKDSGVHGDWVRHVPPLSSYPPAVFDVEDPLRVCELGFGVSSDQLQYCNWEMLSPAARNLPPGVNRYAKTA